MSFFFCSSGILEPEVVRARMAGGAVATLDVREGKISMVSDFMDVFSKEYDLLP